MVLESIRVTLPALPGGCEHEVEINNVAAHIEDKDHLVEFLCMIQDAFTHAYGEDVSVTPELIQNNEADHGEPVVSPILKSKAA